MSEPLPSLDVVVDELRHRLAEQERRAAAFDTRAGLLIASAGVLIAAVPGGDPSWDQLVSQLLALAGAALSAGVLWPRRSTGIDVKALRDKYLAREEHVTRLRLLDTRIVLFERDDQRVESKARLLRLAGLAILSSAGAAVLGSIVAGPW